jgi:hypothetical protein
MTHLYPVPGFVPPATEQTIRNKVLAYIEARPNQRATEIAAVLDIPLPLVRMTVARLNADGLVIGRKEPGVRGSMWTLGMDDSLRDGGGLPKRIIVQSWEQPQIPAQTWLAALGL